MFEVDKNVVYLKILGRKVKVSSSSQSVLYTATFLALLFSKDKDDAN